MCTAHTHTNASPPRIDALWRTQHVNSKSLRRVGSQDDLVLRLVPNCLSCQLRSARLICTPDEGENGVEVHDRQGLRKGVLSNNFLSCSTFLDAPTAAVSPWSCCPPQTSPEGWVHGVSDASTENHSASVLMQDRRPAIGTQDHVGAMRPPSRCLFSSAFAQMNKSFQRCVGVQDIEIFLADSAQPGKRRTKREPTANVIRKTANETNRATTRREHQ